MSEPNYDNLLESAEETPAAQTYAALVYGPAGVGKSTFGKEAKLSAFILLENGVGSLRPRSFPREFSESWVRVKKLLTTLLASDRIVLGRDKTPVETLVFDTIDALQRMIVMYICTRDNPTSKKQNLIVDGKPNIDAYGYGAGWAVALEEWAWLLGTLDRLREKHRINVIFISHAKPRKEKNLEGNDFGVIGPGLNKLAEDLLVAWVDACLYATTKDEVIDEGDAAEKIRAKVVSTDERVVYTASNGAFIAKNRFSLPPEIPLSFAIFDELRRANDPDAVRELRERAVALAARQKDPKWTLWTTKVGTSAAGLRDGVRKLEELGLEAEAVRAELEAVAAKVPPDVAAKIREWVPTALDNVAQLRVALENAKKKMVS